jgi:hypothetical protein
MGIYHRTHGDTEGKKPDIKAVRSMSCEPGTLLVFDRGYVDHGCGCH